ncbi:MAG: hypothetical protein ACERLG_04065 [Sedimentibacter sp.]
MIPENGEKVLNEKYLTYEQMNVLIAIQKTWIKLALWIRLYVNATIYNTPNEKAISNYLINIPSEFYNLFSMFYGTEIAQNVKNHIWNFTKSMMGVVESIKYGDDVLTNSRTTEWYQTADELSLFLSKVNVNWDEMQWKYLLYQYIKIKIDEIHAAVDGNDEVTMELYNRSETISFIITNYFGRGFISSI